MNKTKDCFSFSDRELQNINNVLALHLSKVKDAILELIGKLPTNDFNNKLLTGSDTIVVDYQKDWISLIKTFMESYDMQELYDCFPERYLTVCEAHEKLMIFSNYASVLSSSKDTIENLNKVPFQFN